MRSTAVHLHLLALVRRLVGWAARPLAIFGQTWFVAAASLLFAAVTVLISHDFYRSAFSAPGALETLAGFREQYTEGIYESRFLFRDLLIWMTSTFFAGDIYMARAVLNFLFVLILNGATIALARRWWLTGETTIVLVLVLDLFCVVALYANSNPYTIPSAAFAYLGLAVVTRREGALGAAGLGVGLTLLAAAVVGYEVALLLAPAFAAVVLLESRSALGALVRFAAVVIVAVAAYALPRVVVEATTVTHNYFYLPHNLVHPTTLAMTAFALVALGALLAPVRHRLTDPEVLPLTATVATLVAYAPYVVVFASPLEFRLFLIHVPAALLLFGRGATPAAAPVRDE
jgi:hypothetical protein